MYPRVNYEMTKTDLKELLAACKPVLAIMVGGTTSRSPQENANTAWQALGKKMGFDHMTVKPISGRGERCFSAVLSETESQKAERETRRQTLAGSEDD